MDAASCCFVLGTNSPDVSAIELAAAARHVPLETITVTQPDVMQLYEHRLVLVRPDGHVAWRANEPPLNALALIDKVRGAQLQHSGDAVG